jgi:hypothetical protein
MKYTRRRFATLMSMLGALGIARIPPSTTAFGSDEVAVEDDLWIANNRWATHSGAVRGPAKLYDFMLGYDGTPRDVTLHWNLYRSANKQPLMHIPLNARAVYRWVAAPDSEIFIPAQTQVSLVPRVRRTERRDGNEEFIDDPDAVSVMLYERL